MSISMVLLFQMCQQQNYFDNVMSWDAHIKAIRNKITENIYLQQIKSFLPVNARTLYVNSYILPRIDNFCTRYMGKLFSNTSKLSWKNSLKNLPDNSLMKYLIGKIQHQVMYTNLRWMSIPERISYHQAVHIFIR